MKTSLIISLIIVAAGIMIGWHDHRLLVVLREEHRQLVSELRAMGVSTDFLEDGEAAAPRLSDREYEMKEAKVKVLASKLIEFAKRMEDQDPMEDEEDQKKIFSLMNDIMNLGASEVKMLIAEIRGAEELSDAMRGNMIGFSLMMLSDQQPEVAINIYTESKDLVEDADGIQWMMASTLTKWATADPMAAWDWMSANQEKHSDLMTEDARTAVIAGAAVSNPDLAFQLLGQLDDDLVGDAARQMGRVAAGPDTRAALLEAMRRQSGLKEEISGNMLRAMSGDLAKEGYDAAMEWVDEVKMTDEEQALLAEGFHYHRTAEETGQWLEWMGELEEMPTRSVDRLMKRWTEEDYQAAGEWLNEVEDGQMKSAAIKSYANALVPYAPEAAAEWVVSMPPGEDRDKMVRKVYEGWRGSDAEGADAFARQQGLEVKEE